MARAFLLIRLTFVLVAGLAAASAVSAAGGASSDSGRKAGNSFNLLQPAAAPRGPGSAPSMGASLAPKAVVSNPYNVPLIQNAGSLRSSR
jgi:hypothetical protein